MTQSIPDFDSPMDEVEERAIATLEDLWEILDPWQPNPEQWEPEDVDPQRIQSSVKTLIEAVAPFKELKSYKGRALLALAELCLAHGKGHPEGARFVEGALAAVSEIDADGGVRAGALCFKIALAHEEGQWDALVAMYAILGTIEPSGPSEWHHVIRPALMYAEAMVAAAKRAAEFEATLPDCLDKIEQRMRLAGQALQALPQEHPAVVPFAANFGDPLRKQVVGELWPRDPEHLERMYDDP